jgi:hypothetical protein
VAVEPARHTLFGKEVRHFHKMETLVRLEKSEIEEISEAHHVVCAVIFLVLVLGGNEVEHLLWRHHERASHGVCQYDYALHTHAYIIPTAIVVGERQIAVMVNSVVWSDRALKLIVTRHDAPVDHLAFCWLVVTC